ncbi:MAG: LPS export ABC transporter periplasmic protein LptC [Candidatus Bipolaricaulota bacterium]|nr:LPS export ABC transporter periplasmic protein LptC [Candidatus Bipolaricaulota bacterium]
MFRPRYICILVLLLFGIGLLFIIPSHRKPPPSPTRAKGITLYGYDEEGTPAWSVKAEEGTLTDKDGDLMQVEISIYKAGNEDIWARADRLLFTGEEALLKGGVRINHGDGYHMSTEQATWNQTTGEITASEMRISVERIKIEAGGVSYNLDKKCLSINDGFAAEIDFSMRFSISGDRAREEDGKLVLEGELSVLGEEEEYHCGRIDYAGSEKLILSAGVAGSFPAGSLHAGEVKLTADGGITAREDVKLLLKREFFSR